jgi:hypothetical protein
MPTLVFFWRVRSASMSLYFYALSQKLTAAVTKLNEQLSHDVGRRRLWCVTAEPNGPIGSMAVLNSAGNPGPFVIENL